jgi:hypothetical protein
MDSGAIMGRYTTHYRSHDWEVAPWTADGELKIRSGAHAATIRLSVDAAGDVHTLAVWDVPAPER